MFKKNLIKACIFDAYGTLFDVHAPSLALADKIGEQAVSVSHIWRLKQLEYSWLRSLMGRYTDFWTITQDALDYALSYHGIEDNNLRSELLNMYFSLEAYTDARESLERLKSAGKSTAILSNGSPNMLDAAVKSSQMTDMLDDVLSADEVRVFKPDFRVYDLVKNRFGVLPEEVCFVSSNGWDAGGAAEYGFQVAWINRLNAPTESLPSQPTCVVSSLTEVVDQLL